MSNFNLFDAVSATDPNSSVDNYFSEDTRRNILKYFQVTEEVGNSPIIENFLYHERFGKFIYTTISERKCDEILIFVGGDKEVFIKIDICDTEDLNINKAPSELDDLVDNFINELKAKYLGEDAKVMIEITCGRDDVSFGAKVDVAKGRRFPGSSRGGFSGTMHKSYLDIDASEISSQFSTLEQYLVVDKKEPTKDQYSTWRSIRKFLDFTNARVCDVEKLIEK